ncbi:uncharacterized protein LOC132704430 [Cylas formicarius]|uniref:uncharacterized protein LOC132704430 n=1 Tax=Cylas formicarius TaxID=197179 RepID=UPI0029588448|nr:uncharacterized protein LOC132704430 [Cylas formicarius]
MIVYLIFIIRMHVNKNVVLNNFKQDVHNTRIEANKLGLLDNEINDVFEKLFKELDNAPKKITIAKTAIRVVLFFACFFTFLYILLNVHQPTSSIVLRNVQGLTYPTLKRVRSLSVPIIKILDSLTDWYDESCLIENPYFNLANMECWPCQNMHGVINLTGANQINYKKLEEGTIAIAKTKQNSVNIENLNTFYHHYSKDNLDLRRINTNRPEINTIQALMNYNNSDLSDDILLQWRINKMSTSRVIRKLFPRPAFIPERSGQSVERFLVIAGFRSKPFTLPNTECNFVLMIQGSGERTVIFQPSPECSSKCKRISVVLKPSYALLYNWWYWKPIYMPTGNSTEPSITYISSYC